MVGPIFMSQTIIPSPDFLYINQAGKGFKNTIESSMGHFSHFSMGNDIADVNNDLLPDVFTLDMLPEDHLRQKLLMFSRQL